MDSLWLCKFDLMNGVSFERVKMILVDLSAGKCPYVGTLSIVSV